MKFNELGVAVIEPALAPACVNVYISVIPPPEKVIVPVLSPVDVFDS